MTIILYAYYIRCLGHYIFFPGSTDKAPKVRLYNNGGQSGSEGTVLVKYNNTWNFVNGSDWNFTDAMVVCRELGV